MSTPDTRRVRIVNLIQVTEGKMLSLRGNGISGALTIHEPPDWMAKDVVVEITIRPADDQVEP